MTHPRNPRRPAAAGEATGKVCAYSLLAAGVASIFQILIGADPLVVVMAFGIVAVTLAPIMIYGISHFVGIFFLFMCFYWGFNSIAVKSVMLQPLESYLFSPVLSYLVVFVSVLASSVGAILARPVLSAIPKIAWPIPSPRTLRIIAIVSLVMGLMGIVLARFGGAIQAVSVIFASYTILAFISECARTLILTNRKRTLSLFGVAIGVATVVGSIASNSKFGVLSVPLAYVITVLAFGGRFKISHVIVGILGAIFVSSYVFPAITFIARGDKATASPGQMLVTTVGAVGDLMFGDEGVQQQMEAYNARVNFGKNAATRYDVPYVRHAPLFFERFMLVPYVDAITRRMSLNGPFAGSSFVTKRFANILPVIVNRDKEKEYSGHEILWSLGLTEVGSRGFPTIGLPGETFYAGGLPSVVIFGFGIFFLFSIITGSTIGKIDYSIFGVFMTSRYIHILLSGLSGSYAFFMVRQLLTDIVIFLLVCWCARLFGARGEKLIKIDHGGGL